jgi:hypothetical protein
MSNYDPWSISSLSQTCIFGLSAALAIQIELKMRAVLTHVTVLHLHQAFMARDQ